MWEEGLLSRLQPPSRPSSHTQTKWIPKARRRLPSDLIRGVGVQGAKPLGGFQGGALTFLLSPCLTPCAAAPISRPRFRRQGFFVMRIRNSLKSAKARDKNCRVVRRHGRVYVINKKNPRMKCRQG